MTNHSGEKCLKHTPDTEWVTQFEKLTGRSIGEFDGVEATLWDVVYDYQTNQNSVAEEIVDFISSLLTSRDTYWKERVREEVEGIRKKGNNGEGLPFENSPEIYGNARMEAWKNGHNQALDTLLDNLK